MVSVTSGWVWNIGERMRTMKYSYVEKNLSPLPLCPPQLLSGIEG